MNVEAFTRLVKPIRQNLGEVQPRGKGEGEEKEKEKGEEEQKEKRVEEWGRGEIRLV